MIQEVGGTLPACQRLRAVEVSPHETNFVLPPASMPLTDEDDPLTPVLCHAAAEPTYRERLVRTPTSVLADEGIEIPVGQIVRALEADDAQGYVLVPAKPGASTTRRSARMMLPATLRASTVRHCHRRLSSQQERRSSRVTVHSRTAHFSCVPAGRRVSEFVSNAGGAIDGPGRALHPARPARGTSDSAGKTERRTTG